MREGERALLPGTIKFRFPCPECGGTHFDVVQVCGQCGVVYAYCTACRQRAQVEFEVEKRVKEAGEIAAGVRPLGG